MQPQPFYQVVADDFAAVDGIIRKQLTIVGSWTVNSSKLADCIRFIADHGLEVDKLVTERWTFDQAEEAYKSFDKQASGKGVFVN